LKKIFVSKGQKTLTPQIMSSIRGTKLCTIHLQIHNIIHTEDSTGHFKIHILYTY